MLTGTGPCRTSESPASHPGKEQRGEGTGGERSRPPVTASGSAAAPIQAEGHVSIGRPREGPSAWLASEGSHRR